MGSPFAGQTLEQAKLDTDDESAMIVQVRRGKHVMPVDRQFILGERDVLCFSGDASVFENLMLRPGLEPGRAIAKERTANLLPMYEAVISDTSNLVGKSLKDIEFMATYGGVVLAVQQRSGGLEGAMSDIMLKAGDLLLVGAVAGFEDRWSASHTEFYYVLPRGTSHGKPPNRKILVSLGILGCHGCCYRHEIGPIAHRCIRRSTCHGHDTLQLQLQPPEMHWTCKYCF